MAANRSYFRSLLGICQSEGSKFLFSHPILPMALSSRVIGQLDSAELGVAPRLTKLPNADSSLARQHPDCGHQLQVPIQLPDNTQGHGPRLASASAIPTIEFLPLPMTGRTNPKTLPCQTIDNADLNTEEGGETRSHESQEEEEEGWYQIRCIIGEKRRKKDLWYQVAWANNPKTGKEYEPSWVSLQP